jgi:hypothetical protein
MRRLVSKVKAVALVALMVGLALGFNAISVLSQGRGTPAGVTLSEEVLSSLSQVQRRNEQALFNIRGVVAVGIGLLEDRDEPSIHIYLNTRVPNASPLAVPPQVEGIPVRVIVTDEIKALDGPPGNNHRLKYAKPVPMGVSTGNDNGCFAGTLGYRVFRKGQSSVVGYITNAHVASAGGPNLCPNQAAFSEDQFQPGLLETSCSATGNKIGDLVQFVPVVFGGSFENTVDAAFVASSRTNVNKSILDIGNPSPTLANPALNQSVQKSGRTTGFTTGTITTINTTVTVNYGSGCGLAKFVGQIAITPGTFSSGGDSGSPILTLLKDSSNRFRPVGLLFAGSSTTTIANRLSDVLGALGAQIDTQ